MDAMLAARFNPYWYLSLAAPAMIMLVATYWHRRVGLIVGILLSLVVTYVLCNVSVQEKWRIRNEIATTDSEREYATADGANISFTALIIGPFEAVAYTSLWGVIGWRLWPRLRRKDKSHDVAA